MKEGRKRVFARERIQVDNRTSGIRVAANPTGAMGDTRSSQVVAVTADKSFSKWAAFAPALGALTDMALTIHNKKETEAERQRRKAEEKEENRLNQLQAWEGNKLAMRLSDELNQEIDKGNIVSTAQIHAYTEERTLGINEAEHAALIAQFRSSFAPHYDKAIQRVSVKAQALFNDTLEASARDGIAEGFEKFNFESPEEVNAFFTQSRDLFLEAGKTPEEYDALFIKTSHEIAGALILKDFERAMAVLDEAEKLPGGRVPTMSYRAALQQRFNEHEEKEELKGLRREKLRHEDELASSMVEIGKATNSESLDALRNNAFIKEKELRESMGDAGYVSFLDAINRQHTNLLQQGTRRQAMDAEASAKVALSFQKKISLGQKVTIQEILDANSKKTGDGGLLVGDALELLKSLNSQEAVLAKQFAPLAEAVVEEMYTNGIKTARIQGLNPDDVLQRELYVGMVMDSMREVARLETEEGRAGDSLWRQKLIVAGRAKTEEILKGQNGTTYKSPNDTSESPTSTPIKYDVATWQEFSADPKSHEGLKKALFSGIDQVQSGQTDSGRPLYALGVNRKYFDSIQDPQVKSLAKDMIAQDALERRIERLAIPERTWLGEIVWGAESEEEQLEREYWDMRELDAVDAQKDPVASVEALREVQALRRSGLYSKTGDRLPASN